MAAQLKVGARKVLVLSANPSLKGGTNRAMANVLRTLADEYDFTLLGLSGGASIYPLPTQIDLISLDGPAVGPTGRAARAVVLATRIPRLLRILAEQRPDVVLSLLPRPNILNVVLKRLSGLDYLCVVCERNFTSVQLARGLLNRVLRQTVRAAYRRADLVVANADDLALDMVKTYGVAEERIRTIPNAIDLAAIEGFAAEDVTGDLFEPKTPVILTVGRLIPQKNHDLLLRAFARARGRVPSRLAIIGEGSLLDRSRRRAAELGVADGVAFIGWQDNPFSYMKRAAVFVLSSNHEGFPNVLVEAMACGCPAISTDCPSGPREILESGRTGILVPVEDESALADALVRVLSNPELRADLAVRARARAAQYGLAAVMDSYRTLLSRP